MLKDSAKKQNILNIKGEKGEKSKVKRKIVTSVILTVFFAGFINVSTSLTVRAQPVVNIVELEFMFPTGSSTPWLYLMWYYDSDIIMLGAWESTSGNNNPADQGAFRKGPIPEGHWTVYPEGTKHPETGAQRANRYPVAYGDSPLYGRKGPRTPGFQIHPKGNILWGCIVVKPADYADFESTINPVLNARGTIPLWVDYSGRSPQVGNTDLPKANDTTQLSSYSDYDCDGTCADSIIVGGVGGIVVSVDKFGLLTPHIGLASTILVATVATAIFVKRVKRGKEKQ